MLSISTLRKALHEDQLSGVLVSRGNGKRIKYTNIGSQVAKSVVQFSFLSDIMGHVSLRLPRLSHQSFPLFGDGFIFSWKYQHINGLIKSQDEPVAVSLLTIDLTKRFVDNSSDEEMHVATQCTAHARKANSTVPSKSKGDEGNLAF